MSQTGLQNELPKHVGIIMDGNRRWAKKRKLPIVFGHKKGLEALENIIEPLAQKGIKYVTFYAFSTENWHREEKEVADLMSLMAEALVAKTKILHEKGARVTVIGRKFDLPESIREGFDELEKITSKNKVINVAFAISYGGRNEIIDAVKKIGEVSKLDEKSISANLYVPDFPEPELIIRTGGEQRLSGFLLWQSTYSELYFSNTLWPDFNELELEKALEFFANQKRNFGK